jgi:hypothetical protein
MPPNIDLKVRRAAGVPSWGAFDFLGFFRDPAGDEPYPEL